MNLDDVREEMRDLSDISGPWRRIEYFNPRALVTAVYNAGDIADKDEKNEKKDTFELLPGQIQFSRRSTISDGDITHVIKEIAWVVMPGGLRTDTEEGSTNEIERTSNQHFGTYSMPRVGDFVFIIGFNFASGDGIDIRYYSFGVMGSSGVTRPPPTDDEDMQMVHRSGASIRLNDTYAGGGSIDTDGTSTLAPSSMGGLTGNLTMVGNRTMVLAGSRYLSHGLLAKYGDTRMPFKDLKIKTYSRTTGETQNVPDNKYTELFANTTDTTYYDSFVTERITTNEKFLSPPSTTDTLIPLSDNTLLLSQHGGGVVRIDDHSDDTDYSRLTMTSASVSIMVGTDYQALGRAGTSTSSGTAAGIGGDGNAGTAGDVGTGTDTFEIQHKSGTRITIDEDGKVNIFTRDANASIHIDTESDAKIYLGEGTQPIIKNTDKTETEKAVGAPIMGSTSTTMGALAFPIPHIHLGHKHTLKNTQGKVWV